VKFFEPKTEAQKDALKVFHLGLFMLGFMTMVFSVITMSIGSHPMHDGLVGLVGVMLVVLNAKFAIENTPVSLGFFIMMFGLLIFALGIYEFVWYGGLMYHSEYWNKFCVVVGFMATLGVGITIGGLRFIIKQMRKTCVCGHTIGEHNHD
jgi:hypothetical protein